MIVMSCTQLSQVTDGDLLLPDGTDGDATVDAVATDSRTVPDGRPLFVALRGDSADGHDHVPDAVAAGAVAVLVERGPQQPSVPTIVVDDTWQALRSLGRHVRETVAPTAIAITGSVGKTTVKDLTAAAVGARWRTHASRGSFNNELGVPLTLCSLEPDTQVLVAEIGARHVGDIADLAPLVAPDVAVVTAVAAVHLEVFGSIDAIARAKGELVDALGEGGVAVLALDDPWVAPMAARSPATITVATDLVEADVHAREVRLDRFARPSATAVTPWGEVELSLPIAGRHQIANALFALAVAGHLGVGLTAAAAALASTAVSPWRGAVEAIDGVTVLNDAYNANPTSVVAALQTLVAIERTGRTIAVLGEMAEIGPDAAYEHERIGRVCVDLGVDVLVGVGEAAADTIAGAASGQVEVVAAADAAEASRAVSALVAPGDVVLVKASRVAGLERVPEDLEVRS